MRILALDLGTDTGVAYNDKTGFHYEAWKLATNKEITAWGIQRRHRDPRISRLYGRVKKMCEDFDLQTVVFENVQFGRFLYQTQLWAGFRAAVWLAAPERVRMVSVPVTTLKKFASGRGNATKEEMMAAVARWKPDTFQWRDGELTDQQNGQLLTDDMADAILLHLWAQKLLIT